MSQVIGEPPPPPLQIIWGEWLQPPQPPPFYAGAYRLPHKCADGFESRLLWKVPISSASPHSSLEVVSPPPTSCVYICMLISLRKNHDVPASLHSHPQTVARSLTGESPDSITTHINHSSPDAQVPALSKHCSVCKCHFDVHSSVQLWKLC